MSVAVNTSTPFLPITSLQLQHLQAVTHSFAQRRSTISSVFNNFRTLCVATGVVPSLVRLFLRSGPRVFCSPLFSSCYGFLFPQLSSFHDHPRLPSAWGLPGAADPSFHTDERAIAPSFSGEKNKPNAKS